MEVWVLLGIAGVGAFVLASSVLFDFLGDMGDFLHDLVPGHPFDDAGPFLTKAIFAFLTAFGSAGAISAWLAMPVFVSVLIGIGAGVASGYAALRLFRLIGSQEASVTVTPEDLPGRTAEVTIAIPRNGVGQVNCIVGQTTVSYIAASQDGEHIPSGATVVIAEVMGNRLIVTRSGGHRQLGEGVKTWVP